MTFAHRIAAGALVLAALPMKAGAQTFDAVGSRAAAMGGAFVAVADDSSAAYWNPAGFAAGSFVSLILDRTSAKANSDGGNGAGSQSGWLVALGVPALGLSYYRLRSTILAPSAAATGTAAPSRNSAAEADVRLDTLVTHHAGATLVQSIAPGVAVGATLKLVRGFASSSVQPDGDRDRLLRDAARFVGQASNRFDADVGVMAVLGRLKAGLTIRNLTEPDFESSGVRTKLTLQRQARAGMAMIPAAGWLVAADLDLTKTAGRLGDVRDFAAGAERQVGGKSFVRGGLRLNTVGDSAASVSVGASYAAIRSLLVDAQVTGGSARAFRGWGIAARLIY